MGSNEKNWALVTGASGGIGKEFAKRLSADGWKLILTARDAERLESIRKELIVRGEVIVASNDLSKPGASEKLYGDCASRGLTVDLVVNNAGWGLFGESVSLEASRVEAMVNLNVTALTNISSLFGGDMRARGKGDILNVGSFAGNQATPYFASYAATKSYVLSFSLALRAEMKKAGVNVTCVLPGYVRTDFDENAGIGSDAYRRFSASNSLDASTVAGIGLRALARRRPYVVAGARNKFAAAFFALLPKSFAPVFMKSFLDRLLRSE